MLFLIALQMTLAGVSEKGGAAPADPARGADIAIVPLAIPLLAGPGAISGAILYGTRTRSTGDLGILCLVCVVVGVATFASLQVAERLRRMLGATGIDIATRLMGLLIAAIAVQLSVEGLVALIRP